MGNGAEDDFLDPDALLSEKERSTRQKVRALVEVELLPVIEDCYERGEFPRSMIRGLADLGLLMMKLGGGGSVEYPLACQELERGDSGVRTFMSVASSLVMRPIDAFGSEEQKTR